ncbi:ABC1 kinase family protein [Chondromyces apiculatus]|uniref:Ubiquinone biosynthesis monooxygenase UbiB n=1 Tax=Chondromyces apiculatus DSM 436 TaxID=1192034 RepID=A0A017TC75_9BACT|nr:AarF/ABC1/UbiB kinase family protein [Chondromyces apiculatus]EYF06888.1 Ubiquinone biosynthesis monooxygenase UbiB [Chondromyces apiculatus DSM 436]
MADQKPKDKPPTSKLGRLARLASLAPRAIPFAVEGAKRALGQQRTEEDQAEARKKMTAEVKKTAEAMLKTLGEMKGLPLKFGQMASYIDGLAPPGYEDKFQAALKRLLDKAPPLSPEAAEQMVLQEFGAPPAEVFAVWEREPFAAASIGQVHHAETREGAKVAVKVQYPGMDKAIENDLKSVGVLEAMVAPISRKLHVGQTLDEFRKVFLAELDYAREAEMTDLFRRLHADDPDILVPRVHHGLTTRRVLTTEFMSGMGYTEFCETSSQEARNRAGMALWRFTLGTLLRYGILYADPHPGNYRFHADGRVTVLDYGCVKVTPPELIAGMKRYMRAALDEDWIEFDRAIVEELGYDPNDETWELYRNYTLELLLPLTTRDTWVCSKERAREAVTFLSRGIKEMVLKDGSKLPSVPYVPRMPQDFTFVNRLQWGLASVLAGMRTEGNFREMTEPWVRASLRPLPE